MLKNRLDSLFSNWKSSKNRNQGQLDLILISMDMKGTEARYIRVTVNGAGECPADHVRPGQESRVYFDEIIIE